MGEEEWDGNSQRADQAGNKDEWTLKKKKKDIVTVIIVIVIIIIKHTYKYYT
jgi:hypothetical protein